MLILAALTCGSLGALPLYPGITPGPVPAGGFLTAVLEWIATLLAPDRPTGMVSPRPQPKDGGVVDPTGGGG
jgi:hypothetical protein